MMRGQNQLRAIAGAVLNRKLWRSVVPILAVVTVACGDSPTAPTGPPAPPPPAAATLQTLRVEAVGSLEVGKTTQMRATGSYSDSSTRDLTSQVTWTTSNAAVASISTDGRVTSHAVGNVAIQAAFEGRQGSLALLVLGRNWQVKLILQRIECLGDCEDLTQGQGDFSYRTEFDTESSATRVVAATTNYPSANNVVRLAAGSSSNINRTVEFETRDMAGRFVTLKFSVTEWDELLGSPYADARLDDRSATARFEYEANQDWLRDGPHQITLGEAGCRVRLHYTIVKQ